MDVPPILAPLVERGNRFVVRFADYSAARMALPEYMYLAYDQHAPLLAILSHSVWGTVVCAGGDVVWTHAQMMALAAKVGVVVVDFYAKEVRPPAHG